MKRSIIYHISVTSICLLGSCNPNKDKVADSTPQHFIAKDSANKMIGSYIASLDSNAIKDSTSLYSLIFSASDLRSYLSNTDMEQVKIMFAHNLDYINQGNYGNPAGYSANAFTVVIAGTDVNGNYILDNGKAVNIAMPCPKACLQSGNAANNLIQ